MTPSLRQPGRFHHIVVAATLALARGAGLHWSKNDWARGGKPLLDVEKLCEGVVCRSGNRFIDAETGLCECGRAKDTNPNWDTIEAGHDCAFCDPIVQSTTRELPRPPIPSPPPWPPLWPPPSPPPPNPASKPYGARYVHVISAEYGGNAGCKVGGPHDDAPTLRASCDRMVVCSTVINGTRFRNDAAHDDPYRPRGPMRKDGYRDAGSTVRASETVEPNGSTFGRVMDGEWVPSMAPGVGMGVGPWGTRSAREDARADRHEGGVAATGSGDGPPIDGTSNGGGGAQEGGGACFYVVTYECVCVPGDHDCHDNPQSSTQLPRRVSVGEAAPNAGVEVEAHGQTIALSCAAADARADTLRARVAREEAEAACAEADNAARAAEKDPRKETSSVAAAAAAECAAAEDRAALAEKSAGASWTGSRGNEVNAMPTSDDHPCQPGLAMCGREEMRRRRRVGNNFPFDAAVGDDTTNKDAPVDDTKPDKSSAQGGDGFGDDAETDERVAKMVREAASEGDYGDRQSSSGDGDEGALREGDVNTDEDAEEDSGWWPGWGWALGADFRPTFNYDVDGTMQTATADPHDRRTVCADTATAPLAPSKPKALWASDNVLVLEWSDPASQNQPAEASQRSPPGCVDFGATLQWQVDVGTIWSDLLRDSESQVFSGWFTLQSGVGDDPGRPVAGPSAHELQPHQLDTTSAAFALDESCPVIPPASRDWRCIGTCSPGVAPGVTIGRLRPDSWQRIRVRAANAFGWSAWSPPVQFKTRKGTCALDQVLNSPHGLAATYRLAADSIEQTLRMLQQSCGIEPAPTTVAEREAESAASRSVAASLLQTADMAAEQRWEERPSMRPRHAAEAPSPLDAASLEAAEQPWEQPWEQPAAASLEDEEHNATADRLAQSHAQRGTPADAEDPFAAWGGESDDDKIKKDGSGRSPSTQLSRADVALLQPARPTGSSAATAKPVAPFADWARSRAANPSGSLPGQPMATAQGVRGEMRQAPHHWFNTRATDRATGWHNWAQVRGWKGGGTFDWVFHRDLDGARGPVGGVSLNNPGARGGYGSVDDGDGDLADTVKGALGDDFWSKATDFGEAKRADRAAGAAAEEEEDGRVPLGSCYRSHGWGDRGEHYREGKRQTVSGLACQRWSEQYPHKHPFGPAKAGGGKSVAEAERDHFRDDRGLLPKEADDDSFCRNPDGSEHPWCFTTSLTKRWEICDVCNPDIPGPGTWESPSPSPPPPGPAYSWWECIETDSKFCRHMSSLHRGVWQQQVRLHALLAAASSAAITCRDGPIMEESERVPSKEELQRLGQMSTADPMHGARLEVGGNTQSGYAAHPSGFDPHAGKMYGGADLPSTVKR